jgi:hypothetical protein
MLANLITFADFAKSCQMRTINRVRTFLKRHQTA